MARRAREEFSTPTRRPSLLDTGRKPSVLSHAVSGAVGSVLAEAVLFPVDTVKLQVQTGRSAGGFAATAADIVSKHGLAGLYRGLIGAIIKESVHSFNYWVWHGLLFKSFSKHDDTSRTPPMQRLFLNLLAKQLNWLCTVPFEVVSSVNQLSEHNRGFFSTAVMLYRKGGIGTFYRGLTVSLFLAINPAIMNTLITSLLRIVAAFRQANGADHHTARDHGAAVVGLVTGLAKAVATCLTYPLIRAKVLQQTGRPGDVSLSLVQTLRMVVAQEGLAGLYRGVLAMSYKTVLWNSLMMAFKHLLGPKRDITPPGSPSLTPSRAATLLDGSHFMAREPFPVELLTVEKLDEILSFIKLERGHGSHSQKRIDAMEHRLGEAMTEIREVRQLLTEFIATAMAQGSKRSISNVEVEDVVPRPPTMGDLLKGEEVDQQADSVPSTTAADHQVGGVTRQSTAGFGTA